MERRHGAPRSDPWPRPPLPTELSSASRGEDVRDFLQGLVTNDVALLAPDRPLWAGLLTPQGKALFDFILWADGDDVLIDCEREAAGDLARRLASTGCAGRSRSRPMRIWPSIGRPVAPAGRSPAAGARPPLACAARGDAATGWLAHRLSLGVPEGRAELGSDKILWLEANAAELNGVSFTKGCYVGQENTARMHHRSKVNRRLVVVPAEAPGRADRSIIRSSASRSSIGGSTIWPMR